jgi:hypothetical protein
MLKKFKTILIIAISNGYDTNMIVHLSRKVTNKLKTHGHNDEQSNIKTQGKMVEFAFNRNYTSTLTEFFRYLYIKIA